jgi:hypothetical protein
MKQTNNDFLPSVRIITSHLYKVWVSLWSGRRFPHLFQTTYQWDVMSLHYERIWVSFLPIFVCCFVNRFTVGSPSSALCECRHISEQEQLFLYTVLTEWSLKCRGTEFSVSEERICKCYLDEFKKLSICLIIHIYIRSLLTHNYSKGMYITECNQGKLLEIP